MKEFGSSPAPRAESGNKNAAAACPSPPLPALSTSTKPSPSAGTSVTVPCLPLSHSCPSGLKVAQSLPTAPNAGTTNCSEKSLASESGDGRKRAKLEHRPLEQPCNLSAVLGVQELPLVHHWMAPPQSGWTLQAFFSFLPFCL